MMKFLFSGNGRVSRKAIWLFNLAVIGISIVFAILDLVFFGTSLDSDATGPLSLLFSLASIWPSIAVTVKRFHDRGMSGWWIVWFILIAVAAAIPGGIAMAVLGVGQGFGITIVFIGVAIPLIWQFVILMIQPGQEGPNKYGPNPLDPVGEDIARTFD